MGDLVLIKNESCSRRNFAFHQAERMFTKEEWVESNVGGKKGKKMLDPVRIYMYKIKEATSSFGHWKGRRGMMMHGKSARRQLMKEGGS